MALAIDASSPPIVSANVVGTGTHTVTTASFTPPANSLLVILCGSESFDAATDPSPGLSVTDNLGVHLTYTQRVYAKPSDTPAAGGTAAVYTAPVATSAAMTVSLTYNTPNGGNDLALQVQVLTAGGVTPTVGANGKTASGSAGTTIAASYTATGTNSWGFAAVNDWNATGNMTAGVAGNTLISTISFTGNSSYGFFRRTTADGVSGSTTTLTATLGGSSSSKHIAVAEVLDPGGAAPSAPPPGILFLGPTRG